MQRLFTLFFILVTPFFVQAQTFNSNCDGSRFLSEVFPDEPTMTTVKFGENTTISGNFQELFMDVFEPAGDVAENRPVLLFAFGGAFIGGERASTHDICKAFAKKGYVTAAIDYRLYDIPFPPIGPLPDSLDMMEVVMHAVGDYKAAVRYFRKDAETDNTYRIDPNFIFTGGYSAGSIASLHAAYLDDGEAPDYVQMLIDMNGGLEGNTDNPDNSSMGYPSDIQATVNYFGALHRKEWVDAGDPPMVSIHGDADPTVPYGHGNAVVVVLPLISVDGSGVLHPYAESVGLMSELITVPGGGHGNFTQAEYDSMEDLTTTFLGEILCGDITANEELPQLTETKAFPNPSPDQMHILFAGQPSTYDVRILNQLGQTVFVETNQTQSEFFLNKSDVGSGIFVLEVTFENENIQPVLRKIVFE